MDTRLLDLVNEAVRVLFLALIPVVGAGFVAGILCSILQVATSLQDEVFSYCFRLVACIVAVGLLCVSISQSLRELLLGALG